MRLGFLSLLVWSLIFATCQADLLDYAQQLPDCGLTCVAESLPLSACSSLTDATCVCTDVNLYQATGACALSKCSVAETLELARIYTDACALPKREKRSDIPGMMVLQACAVICVGIRLYIRFSTATKVEVDDVIVVFMVLVYIGFCVMGNFIRISVMGFDIWTLQIELIEYALQAFYIAEILYTTVLALCRIGILFFLIRVFSSLNRFRVVCWVVMAWVVVTAVVIILLTTFQCWPVDYNWLGWRGDYERHHQCLDINVLGFTAAGLGVTQDLVILILPLRTITTLNMPRRRKLLTLCMFSLGIAVTVISCLRLRSLLEFAATWNPTWDYTEVVIWTAAEVHVAVIVLCLPAMRTLFVRVFPRAFGSETTKNTGPRMSIPGKRGVWYRDITKQSGNDSSGLESGYGYGSGSSGSKTRGGGESIELPGRVHVTTLAVDGSPEAGYNGDHGWDGPGPDLDYFSPRAPQQDQFVRSRLEAEAEEEKDLRRRSQLEAGPPGGGGMVGRATPETDYFVPFVAPPRRSHRQSAGSHSHSQSRSRSRSRGSPGQQQQQMRTSQFEAGVRYSGLGWEADEDYFATSVVFPQQRDHFVRSRGEPVYMKSSRGTRALIPLHPVQRQLT